MYYEKNTINEEDFITRYKKYERFYT